MNFTSLLMVEVYGRGLMKKITWKLMIRGNINQKVIYISIIILFAFLDTLMEGSCTWKVMNIECTIPMMFIFTLVMLLLIYGLIYR